MGINNLYLFIKAPIILLIALSCFSCNFSSSDQQESERKIDPKFALYVLKKENPVKFVLTDKLDTSTTTLQIDVPAPNFSREYISKGKSLFLLNHNTENFIRYDLAVDNKFAPKDSLYLGETGDVEHFHWQGSSDTLFLFTIKRDKGSKGYLHIIDSRDMALISKRVLPLPAAIDNFNLLNIGLAEVSDKNLWIGYSYSKYLADGGYTTIDTMYFTTINLQDFSIKKTQKDTRSSYPGGINTVQSYAAKNEAGDLYFMSCPGIALGNNIDAPTAIFRKQKGSDVVDSDYMIDISKEIKNHAYGLWYIGEQKAIIRSERKDRYTDFSNHHSTYQFEYYIVDLNTGILSKLDLPFDKGTRKENVLVDGKSIYIGIDDQDDNHCIWEYNSQTQQIKKTITLSKSVDFILRIDPL